MNSKMKIYKITNKINGKIYIGQTIRDLDERQKRHINDAKKGDDLYFHRAILKYGEENFIIEEIDSAETQTELNKKEIYYIGKYNSYENGYNSTFGGEGGNTYSKKTKEELEIIRKKIAKANTGKNNGMATPIKCVSVKTGEILIFETNQACRNYFNSKNKTFITNRCLGRIKSLYKKEWKISYANS